MQRQLRHAVSRPRCRRGLAPLEFVLALPLMLFVMALIINIGSLGAWKVREQANVRNASWRTMHLRTGDNNPNPPMWPVAAVLSGGTGDDLAEVANVWDTDTDLLTEAVRGAVVADPNSGMSIRVNPKLVMKEGVHDGRAPLERTIPMLRGILPDNGAYRFDIRQNVLDGPWEFHNMGYIDNYDRRARLLYQIQPDDFPSSAQLKSQLDSGPLQALRRFPLAGDLAPLDDDPHLRRLSVLPPQSGQSPAPPPSTYGVPLPPASGEWAPDFYPDKSQRTDYRRWILRNICIADPTALRADPRYDAFLGEIRRLPGVMARDFRRWYEERLDYLQNLMQNQQQNQQPLPPGTTQEIQWLQDRIDELNDFLSSIPRENQ